MRFIIIAGLCALPAVAGQQYLDRFNYHNTEPNSAGFTDYAPQEWDRINCDEANALDQCEGYPDKWEAGISWSIRKNYCRSCPLGDTSCGRHHQSPINLQRDRGLEGHPNEKECIDVHWMKYEDSFCRLDQLERANAFTIERHALRVSQPITVTDNVAKLNCRNEGVGFPFGRLDYSKGFSQWWFLSHIDIHTPSEHTQEGVRYDGEIQLQHFYSVSEEFAGVENEMGTVSAFMNAYDDAPPYRYLDKVICQWRRYEYQTRSDCGLNTDVAPYPGCMYDFDPSKHSVVQKEAGGRQLRQRDGDGENAEDPKAEKRRRVEQHQQPFKNAFDIILHNDQYSDVPKLNSSRPTLLMDEKSWDAPEEKNWEAFIQGQSDLMQSEDRCYKRAHAIVETKHQEILNSTHYQLDTVENATSYEEVHDEYRRQLQSPQHRRLIQGDEINWFNYWPMLGVRTEYYFRYEGSQTIPPCYGNAQSGTRRETNHWRVLKDPIRIHPRQLRELERLQRERIAPTGSKVDACRPDTAAKVNGDNTISTARPVQDYHNSHGKVFCECKDWPSKWPEDRYWCRLDSNQTKFYDHPYNFKTNGFAR